MQECQDQVHDKGLALVGFNLGGSLAAYFARRSATRGIKAIVICGSVPRLSTFWAHSPHPAAATARRAAERDRLPAPEPSPDLDLATSLAHIQDVPILLQFGRRDTWIDGEEAEELASLSPSSCILRWYDDDHDMASLACRRDRLAFLRGHMR